MGRASKSKLSMFCAHFQNYQHCFWKVIYASWSKLSKKVKTGIKISAGHTVLELSLLIKMCKILFWLITQELLSLLKWCCHCWISHTICFRMHVSFFQKNGDNFWDSTQNMLNLGLGCPCPLKQYKILLICELMIYAFHVPRGIISKVSIFSR